MPNWIYNEVEVDVSVSKGNSDITVAKLIEAMKGRDGQGENEFDFNKVLAPPPEVEADDEALYRWHVANWDTKWNSDEARVMDSGNDYVTFVFNTAWGTPRKLLAEFARKFGVQVRCAYYDTDDLGMNCGRYQYDCEGGLESDERHNDLDEGYDFIADEFGEEIMEMYGYRRDGDGNWTENEDYWGNDDQ